MTQVEQAYAQGLYALAQEENITEELMQQLTVLEETVGKDREYLDLLSTPALSKDERCQVLDQAFRDQVHIYVLNFMKILTEKGYIRHFSGCCRAFRQQYNQDRGILPVRAVSAVMLSDTQKERLQQTLEQRTGKTVQLQCSVDPTVLGGVRLDYDGMRIDGTVQTRLDALGRLIQDAVL